MNGLMAIPNLIGLLGLSGVIVFETKRFNAKLKEEKEAAKRGKSPFHLTVWENNEMISPKLIERWTILWIYLTLHQKMFLI